MGELIELISFLIIGYDATGTQMTRILQMNPDQIGIGFNVLLGFSRVFAEDAQFFS